MRIPLVMILLVLTPAIVAAQEKGAGEDSIGPARPPLPSLEDLFLDLSTVLGKVDAGQAVVLRERLEWTERRIVLLRRFLKEIRSGIHLQMPRELESESRGTPDPALRERLRREVAELRNRYRIAATGDPGVRVAQGGAANERVLTTMGMAVLTIEPTLPPPPDTPVGSEEVVQRAADKEALGKSLERLGDYRGAFNAYSAIPEEKRGPGIWYRLGFCAERLEQWEKAKGCYAKVVELEPNRIWGRMAKERLEWGNRLHAVGTKGRGGR